MLQLKVFQIEIYHQLLIIGQSTLYLYIGKYSKRFHLILSFIQTLKLRLTEKKNVKVAQNMIIAHDCQFMQNMPQGHHPCLWNILRSSHYFQT